MSSAGRTSVGHINNNHNHDLNGDDLEVNNNTGVTPGRSGDTEAWWTVAEDGEGRKTGLTHQSAKLTLTGNVLFGPQRREEVWDLTDSLIDLYEQSQRRDAQLTTLVHRQPPTQTNHDLGKDVSIQDWLTDDQSHGFIRVYSPSSSAGPLQKSSQLVPCSLSTSAHRVCLMLGVSINALHVQMNGDIIRRLDPYEHPLVLQNDFLSSLGYTDLERIQQEGTSEDLAFLIRFYAGKPMYDSTFSRSQLQANIDIKKPGMLQQWTRRLCVISGTRLLIYKDKQKRALPTDIQLAKGGVEEVKFKGHDHCLKLTSTVGGDKTTFLSFPDATEYNKWYRKCKKATDKLPTAADLSRCHLEFLPENLFINEQLAMLNLRHNVLRERPLDEDIYTIGWLDDLNKFSHLRSLNLANNSLLSFPMSLCQMKTLVELNIASNKLTEIPTEICGLTNLQALHLHNNHLTSLPAQLVNLRKLFILVLAFNRFTSLPPVVAQMTNVRTSEVENIIMSGNQIEKITSESLMEMKYVKKIYLRMNCLTLTSAETMRFTVLEHVTHLDLRDNQISDLDVRALKTLEYLNVERNDMVMLQVNGMALKNLFAAHNCLEKLSISPKPEWLLQMDVSFNCLTQLPEWLSECFFLQKIWASHNLITQLPLRILTEARKLKSLRVDHNRLVRLPTGEIEGLALEELYLHHNLLIALPQTLLQKACRLRVLNLTKNRLSGMPPLNETPDLNKVQELYLSGNCLGDAAMQIISGFPRLKILHVAQNEIYNLYDSDVKKMESLTELNVSTNQLRALPSALGLLSKLVILRAHSNCLQTLPDLKNASSLRILDVGHNQLLNVSVTHLMASQLDLLDMSLNAKLKVDPREFKSVKNKKSICLVDLTGQNRLLPGLKGRKGSVSASVQGSTRADSVAFSDGSSVLESQQLEWGIDPSMPWKVGFVESSGIRNKLCVATLKILNFGSENEALFGMFDGGHNNEVPSQLLGKVEDIVRYEQQQEKTDINYMKYTMLSAHRSLGGCGQRLGASALLCHLHRVASDTESVMQYTLHIANLGDVEAVMCRRGEALLLTRKFVTTEDRDECQRVYKSDGILTEDNKVNGTTKNTRMLGCGYLHPHVIPDPHTDSVALRNDDEFIIIANKGLWRFISYEEAVEEIYETGNPVVAAKQLQDLALGYGSQENLAILVVRLNTDQGPSLARLRQHKSMSIDDVEAAALHDAKLLRHKEKRREDERRRVQGREERRKKKATLVDVRRIEEQEGEMGKQPDKRGRPRSEVTQTSASQPVIKVPQVLPVKETRADVNAGVQEKPARLYSPRANSPVVKPDSPLPPPPPPIMESSHSSAQSADQDLPPPPPPITETPRNQSPVQEAPYQIAVATSSVTNNEAATLKPLPKHRYVKKDTANDWEEILQSRLSQEVKDLEMKQMSSSMIHSEDIPLTEIAPHPQPACGPQESMQVDLRVRSPSSQAKSALKRRTVASPWGLMTEQNLADKASNGDVGESGVVSQPRAKRGSIAQTIALFENRNPSESGSSQGRKARSLSVPRESSSHRDPSPTSPALKKSRSPPVAAQPTYQLSFPHQSRTTLSPASPTVKPSPRSPPVTKPSSLKPPPPPPAKKPSRPTPSTSVPIQPARESPVIKADSVEGNLYPTVSRVDKEESPVKRNVSSLVRMFGAGKTTETSSSGSVEVEEVDGDGQVHVYEIAKL